MKRGPSSPAVTPCYDVVNFTIWGVARGNEASEGQWWSGQRRPVGALEGAGGRRGAAAGTGSLADDPHPGHGAAPGHGGERGAEPFRAVAARSSVGELGAAAGWRGG